MANSTDIQSVSAFAEQFRDVIRETLAIEIATRKIYVSGTEIINGDEWLDLPSSFGLDYYAGNITDDGFEDAMAPYLYWLYVGMGKPEWLLREAQDVVAGFLVNLIQQISVDDVFIHLTDLATLHNYNKWMDGVGEVMETLTERARQRIQEGEGAIGGVIGGPLGPSARYPFSHYEPESVNLGLQIVYRQRWVPLGTQPGEIIRTLPLGPKQTEKVTVKAVRRTKSTRQTEIVTSIETATESSAATKDSQEIVQEASESFKWHVEAKAEASWGFGSASVEAGAESEEERSSKDAKSTLNETMEKTASKIKQDTKIVISTEVEETTELSRASEISNPNDELAVTYVYSRLQRQYEIHTYLSEVNTCIFVAEKMPNPAEITGSWIRQYDWIIAQALLDESFRSDLEVIRSSERDQPVEDMDPEIQSLMRKFSENGLPDYTSLPGQLTNPDIFATPQNAYEREVERKRARDKDTEAYKRAERRLRHHIFDNILHYMRAIWSAEDTDARLMRYQQMDVPTWGFRQTGYDSEGNVEGEIVPGPEAPLSELINPAARSGMRVTMRYFT